jgi:hypothetical protein
LRALERSERVMRVNANGESEEGEEKVRTRLCPEQQLLRVKQVSQRTPQHLNALLHLSNGSKRAVETRKRMGA